MFQEEGFRVDETNKGRDSNQILSTSPIRIVPKEGTRVVILRLWMSQIKMVKSVGVVVITSLETYNIWVMDLEIFYHMCSRKE